MDFMIVSTSKPAASSDASKAAQPKNGRGADEADFDAVLRQEEEKMSSEAEALMLAMLAKPQTNAVSDQTKGAVSAGSSLPDGLAAAVTEQVDGVGTSQSKTADLIQTEVTSATQEKTAQAAKNLEGSAPISFQEISSEAVDLQDVEIDPKMIKAEAEAQQRTDQVSKAVVEAKAPSKGNEIKIDSGEGLSQPDSATQKQTETTAKEMEFTKVQVDQITKSNPMSEPARMAEALPRQTIHQLSEQIEMLIQQGRSSLRLQLSPEHLGRIDIRLVNSGHGMGVTVLTEQAETGKLLQAQLDQLRQTLQEAGIQLSHLNVGQHPHSSHNAWQTQDQKRRFLTRTTQGAALDRVETQPKPLHLRTETGVDYRI